MLQLLAATCDIKLTLLVPDFNTCSDEGEDISAHFFSLGKEQRLEPNYVLIEFFMHI